MIKLYTAAGSCSTASHIALQESGVPFETQIVTFDSGFLETKEMLVLNPKGYVPFLAVDAGKGLAEGSAILQYIAELAPEKNLFPTKGFERFKALEWLNFTATELHKTIGGLFSAETLVPDETARKQYVETVHGMLSPKLAYLDQSLEAKNFILGQTYSVVDAYLFVVLGWTKYLNIDLSPYKNIVSFQGRVLERPATQRAMKAEGILGD